MQGICRQVRDRDSQQEQIDDALRHGLLLLLQAT
jgi:hypothetical protein